MVHEFMEIERRLQAAEVERLTLAQQAQGKLMEGQNMNLDQGKALSQAQQAFQVIAQRVRWHDDGKRSERVGRFQPAEIRDKGGFKMGMKRSCDYAKHQPLRGIMRNAHSSGISHFLIPHSSFPESSRFRAEELAVTVDATPIAVDKRHRLAADPAIRRRSFVDRRKNRKLNI